MQKHTTEPTVASSATGEHLKTCLRGKMREWIQDLLEAEVDELLGHRKSERRKAVDGAPGYRSGHGKPRRLTLRGGTVTVRRPRVRGLAQRFESRLLPLFARRTPEVTASLPELYLHGLAQGDFDLALRGLVAPKLVIGDEHLGIWVGLRNVYPDAQEQRCWNHRTLNALDKVPKTRQAHARLQVTRIPYADTRQEASG